MKGAVREKSPFALSADLMRRKIEEYLLGKKGKGRVELSEIRPAHSVGGSGALFMATD